MTASKDYYKVLGVIPEAPPEVIKASYKALAKLYHPDLSSGDKHQAEIKMKQINEAYEFLSDEKKRSLYDQTIRSKRYHTTTQSKEQNAPGHQKSSNYDMAQKPKPVVFPQYISFENVEPGEIQTSFFEIKNMGGSYGKIRIDQPESFVKVVWMSSVTTMDELPMRVKLQVTGDDWGKLYSEDIKIKLDEEEVFVRIELQTKDKPMKWSGLWIYFITILMFMGVSNLFLYDYAKTLFIQYIGFVPRDAVVTIYSLIDFLDLGPWMINEMEFVLMNGIITSIVFMILTTRVYLKIGYKMRILLHMIALLIGAFSVVLSFYMVIIAVLFGVHVIISKVNKSFYFRNAYLGFIIHGFLGFILWISITVVLYFVSFAGLLFDPGILPNAVGWAIIVFFAITGFFKYGNRLK